MDIKLSIIIPTYNRAELLRQCLENCCFPSKWKKEVIIVDDASIDSTAKVVNEFLGPKCHAIFKYIPSKINRGAPTARNTGLHVAQGDFVMFVDSDDVIVSSGIKSLIETLNNHSLDYAFGRVKRVDADLNPLAGDQEVGAPFRLDGNGIFDLSWHTMGAIYRRHYILKHVGDWHESLTGSQDWEFQARVKMSGGKGEFVNTVVGFWRRHAGPRIGTSGFRPAYLDSVQGACLSIEEAAVATGNFDDLLRRRLCRRLINHMLEACANRDKELTANLGGEAKRLSYRWSIEQFICWIVMTTKSSWISIPLLKLIRSK